MYRRIAIVYDESAASERALSAAVSLASLLNAELAIVSVTKSVPGYAAYAESIDPQVAQILEHDQDVLAEQRGANAANVAKNAHVTHSVHSAGGAQVNEILSVVTACASELLVIGLHADGLLISRLWSRAYALAQDAPCSVLGVH